MRSFASDNNSGVHPLVMEALNRANIDPVSYTHLDVYKRQTYSLTGTDANLFEVSTAGSVSLKTSGLIASLDVYKRQLNRLVALIFYRSFAAWRGETVTRDSLKGLAFFWIDVYKRQEYVREAL